MAGTERVPSPHAHLAVPGLGAAHGDTAEHVVRTVFSAKPAAGLRPRRDGGLGRRSRPDPRAGVHGQRALPASVWPGASVPGAGRGGQAAPALGSRKLSRVPARSVATRCSGSHLPATPRPRVGTAGSRGRGTATPALRERPPASPRRRERALSRTVSQPTSGAESRPRLEASPSHTRSGPGTRRSTPLSVRRRFL